jgi:hypothetical protein
MLRTASSLPLAGLLTLGSGPARFQAKPPACYRASWQLPGPDFHRQATTSLRTRRNTMAYVTVSPPVLLGARNALTDRQDRSAHIPDHGRRYTASYFPTHHQLGSAVVPLIRGPARTAVQVAER